ncbi:CoA ester lyase [Micrococcales bacterium 31B]|nr:CoA ester lyase [Micrococcales bacterium 31B]
MTFTLGPSLLFVPADRPERYAKAAERADAIIVDLEDAVAEAAKEAARASVREHLPGLDLERTVVRVNPVGTPAFEPDLRALDGLGVRYVMLAKAEAADQLDALAGYRVLALCETAAGVLAAPEIARHPACVALMWGAEDLVASLGGSASRTPRGTYRDIPRFARSAVALAAAAAGRAAIDAVYLDIADTEGLRAEAEDAAALGFAATACIHPSQAGVIRAAYAPTEDEVAWARAVLAAAETERGVFTFEGRMVDEPVLRHARRVVARV